MDDDVILNKEDELEEVVENSQSLAPDKQRNGRKRITTIAGLASDLNFQKLLKAFKKNFQCNGSIEEDERHGRIIKLFGDQRQNIKQFLIDEEIIETDNIVIHGA